MTAPTPEDFRALGFVLALRGHASVARLLRDNAEKIAENAAKNHSNVVTSEKLRQITRSCQMSASYTRHLSGFIARYVLQSMPEGR